MKFSNPVEIDEFNKALQSNDEEYKKWATSGDASEEEKCFRFAVYLRSAKYSAKAYDVSKYLTENNPSLKSYNIYLASTYDRHRQSPNSVDENTLKKVFDDAWDFYKDKEFEPNITSTLLKCGNLLIEYGLSTKDVFNEIYNRCPYTIKSNNSYIIVQYYNRLIAEGRMQEVLNSYRELSQALQKNTNISRLLKRIQDNSQSKKNSFAFNGEEIKKIQKLTIVSNSNNVGEIGNLLSRFSIETESVDIHSDNLTGDLNRATFKATASIIMISDIQKVSTMDTFKWAFVIGYCTHKFSQDKIILFADVQPDLPSLQSNEFYNYLTTFNLNKIKENLDIITTLGDQHIISG